jgi:mRNA-degrading endonuclease toxin of MazEF toxin-antitoxin module
MPPVIVGGLYFVADHKIVLPPEEERMLHQERRRFVVLTSADTNRDPEWPTVLGAPLSASTRYRTRFDVKIAAAEAGTTKKCWIRIPAVQPLKKSDLEDLTGVLSEQRLWEARARLFHYIAGPQTASTHHWDDEAPDTGPIPPRAERTR